MTKNDRSRGWDKQAVNRIAEDHYDGLEKMFEAHGWAKGDKTYGQIAPTKVVQTYGNVEAFSKAHEDGKDSNAMLDARRAFQSNPPQVFLKSYYGFNPDIWGFLGYTDPTHREKFIRDSKPGACLIVCGTSKATDPKERLRVLGMQQQTHIKGTKWDFMDPEYQVEERADPDRKDRWYHALKAIRAWIIPEEERPFVRDIFPETHDGGKNGTTIGTHGRKITFDEAQKFLKLPLYEVPIFGGHAIADVAPAKASEVLKPSPPGPVAQSGRWVFMKEAEGPKHLYIMELKGVEIEAFAGEPAAGRKIVKVGFSKWPSSRCKNFNKTLPGNQIMWTIFRSTFDEKLEPFESSFHAKEGEQTMVRYLAEHAKSLGGEFFLAKPDQINQAWDLAKQAAQDYLR